MAITASLPVTGALSEFVAGFHGDCGEDAELMALHAVRGVALTAADLAAIVKRHQAHGWADASGAEPLSSIAHDLDLLGVHYTQYRYQEPWAESAWHPLLLANAGRKPIILQVANAQALPGDEAGVHYHFVCIQAINPTGYVTGDGDNVAARSGRLVTYNIGELEAARPCGMIICELESGGLATMDLTGIGSGVRAFLATQHFPASYKVLLAEEPDEDGTPGSTMTVFGDDSTDVLVYWDGKGGYATTTWGGHAVTHVVARARRAEARVKELEAQLATAQSAAPVSGTPDPKTRAAEQMASALKVLMA